MTTQQILTELKIEYAAMFSALFGKDCNTQLNYVFSEECEEVYNNVCCYGRLCLDKNQFGCTLIKYLVNQACIDILVANSNLGNEMKLILSA